ncbi:periplasmic binding protein-like II [Anaeromyces robustus]|uniref:Periplasmic binding protein-like II n=1 Tax=Anaeromyces robustus TaxID=1754192 RepID=A0A1Y1VXV4_9FUNG|nr:periplasmic binding protein-like II [Anaeromyces robustus]|eukprot:ORX66087.1 periplasmic binding protein-like II [Anaeromyces robustus]
MNLNNTVFKIIIIAFFHTYIIKAKTVIKAITYTYYGDSYYQGLVDAFNEYSEINNLDIELQLKVLTPENSTSEVDDYGFTLDALISKKSKKYDIYIFYGAYSKKFGEHLADLNNYLSKNHINKFDNGILSGICTSLDNKLVGLPIAIDISVLYSNINLLNKYKKDIPKTWDEFLSTAKYILYQERKDNNTDLVAYNGLINENNGDVPIYEFINSYRESNSSPHPELTSKTTIEALEMLKKIKNEISSDSEFQLAEDYTMRLIYVNTNALFLRFWYVSHSPVYELSPIPGYKDGVSGSLIVANNIGINNYISEENKLAAAEIIKFMTTMDTQKKYITNKKYISAINELYDDDDVCALLNCDLIKKVQPFSFMNNNLNEFGNDAYHEKYRKYISEFLYNNKSVTEVLKKINDITRIYSISLNTDDSYLGLIVFIIFSVIMTVIMISVIFLFIKKFYISFMVLTKDLWIISLLGTLIILCSVLTLYDVTTIFKCQLRIFLITFGYVVMKVPFLYNLIVRFPEKNKISFYLEKHKYLFIFIILLFNLVLNILMTFSPSDVSEVNVLDGGNYKRCVINTILGNIFYYLILFHDGLIIIIMLILIYMEWNIKETYYDIRLLATVLFMDILSIILFNIINNIIFNDYIAYNALLSANIILFSILNHIFTYFVKIGSSFLPRNSTTSLDLMKRVMQYKNDSFNNTWSIASNTMTSENSNTATQNIRNSFINKIVEYHNQNESI